MRAFFSWVSCTLGACIAAATAIACGGSAPARARAPGEVAEPAPALQHAQEASQAPAKLTLDDRQILWTDQVNGCVAAHACNHEIRMVVVLEVAPDGTVTDAAISNPAELDSAETECLVEVFRNGRFTKLPRPPRIDLHFSVCRPRPL